MVMSSGRPKMMAPANARARATRNERSKRVPLRSVSVRLTNAVLPEPLALPEARILRRRPPAAHGRNGPTGDWRSTPTRFRALPADGALAPKSRQPVGAKHVRADAAAVGFVRSSRARLNRCTNAAAVGSIRPSQARAAEPPHARAD